MKRFLSLILTMLLLCGCAAKKQPANAGGKMVSDFNGHIASFETCPTRVVALSGSLGEVWLNAGGSLIGTTEDAVSQRSLPLGKDTAIVGTIKEPNLELILSLEPDFLILSADIASHQELAQTLDELMIPYGLFHEEYFQDYLSLLKQFTDLTGRKDCYETCGLETERAIQSILEEAPGMNGKTVLLLRAYSSGVKAKGADNLAGTILADFGLVNVLDGHTLATEEVSLEALLQIDPDYIFLTTMGADTKAAEEQFAKQLSDHPAWAALTAVKSGRVFTLPKELFHYKPNARWAEAYAFAASALSE